MTYALTQELYIQVRAFLRSIENGCNSCLRRNLGYCDDCDARMAKILGERMDAGVPKTTNLVDTSLTHRMDVILSQMRKAKRPLRSVDIDTQDYCSKELKRWTLNKLISLGKIKRETDGYFHVYSLVEGKTKKEKHKNGCN